MKKMNYEKGEPSVFMKNQTTSDSTSVIARYLSLFKSRRYDQRRKKSRSPDRSAGCTLQEGEVSEKHPIPKCQDSQPRVKGSDQGLHEVEKRKVKEFVSTSTSDSNSRRRRAVYGCNLAGRVGHIDYSRDHEMSPDASMGLGVKNRSLKDVLDNVTARKSLNMRDNLWRRLKFSTQSPNFRGVGGEAMVNPTHAEQRSDCGQFSGIKARSPSKNARPLEEFSRSGLDMRLLRQGFQENDSLENNGNKKSSFTNYSSDYYEQNHGLGNSCIIHDKPSGNSEQLKKTVDNEQYWSGSRGLDYIGSRVDSRRKKRCVRNSSNKYETQIQDRHNIQQNFAFLCSGPKYDISTMRQHTRTGPDTPAVPEYEQRKSYSKIQCENKNFSYSQNFSDSVGFAPSPSREGGKQLWEETILEESTVSSETTNEQYTYRTDENKLVWLDSAPKEQNFWSWKEKGANIQSSCSNNDKCCDEDLINSWNGKTKQETFFNYHQERYAQQKTDRNQVPYCSVNSDNVQVPNMACTSWIDISSKGSNETTDSRWAYEVYSSTNQIPPAERGSGSSKIEPFLTSFTSSLQNDEFNSKFVDNTRKNSYDLYEETDFLNYKLKGHDKSFKDSRFSSFVTSCKQNSIESSPNDKAWVGSSELGCNEQSGNATHQNVQINNSRKADRYQIMKEPPRYLCNQEIKVRPCNQVTDNSTHKPKAVLANYSRTKQESTTQKNNEVCFQHNVVNDSAPNKKSVYDCGVSKQRSSKSESSSRQTPCVNEKLMKTVHSIKEDIESVLQMLISLEMQEIHEDIKTSLILKETSNEDTLSSNKLETMANVSCATDFVKRAFEKLMSVKKTFVKESTEDLEDTSSRSYEFYKKGKEDFISNAQNEEEGYEIEAISPYKHSKQERHMQASNANPNIQEKQVLKNSIKKSASRISSRSEKSSNIAEENNKRRQCRVNKSSLAKFSSGQEGDSLLQDKIKSIDILVPKDSVEETRNTKHPAAMANGVKSKVIEILCPCVQFGETQVLKKPNKIKSSLSPKVHNQKVPENFQEIYPPSTFLTGKETIYKSKAHKRRKKATWDEELKWRCNEILKNKRSQGNSPFGTQSKFQEMGGRVPCMKKSSDKAESKQKEFGKVTTSIDTDIESIDKFRTLTNNTADKVDLVPIKQYEPGTDNMKQLARSPAREIILHNFGESQPNRSSPSPKPERVKVFSAKISITPQPSDKSVANSDHADKDSSGGKEIFQTEMLINKYVVVGEETDSETKPPSSDQSSHNLAKAAQLKEPTGLSQGQWGKKWSRRKRSSRNRRKRNSFLSDKYASDASRVSSSDTNLVKTFKKVKIDTGKRKKALNAQWASSPHFHASSTTFCSPNVSDSPKYKVITSTARTKSPNIHDIGSSNTNKTRSPKLHVVVSTSTSGIRSPKTHGVVSASTSGAKSPKTHHVVITSTGGTKSPKSHGVASTSTGKTKSPKSHDVASGTSPSQETLRTKDKATNSEMYFNPTQNANETIACPLIERNEHAFTKRKHKNDAKTTAQRDHSRKSGYFPPTSTAEKKSTKKKSNTLEINAPELNFSIKKLYDEINKLRIQLEASAQESISVALQSEKLQNSYKIARSYKAISSQSPSIPENLEKNGKAPTKANNNKLIKTDTKKALVHRKNYLEPTILKDTSKVTKFRISSRQKFPSLTEESEDKDLMEMPCETNGECKYSCGDVGKSAEEFNKSSKYIPNLKGVPRRCAGWENTVKTLNDTLKSDLCQDEHVLSGKADNQTPIYWPNDDVCTASLWGDSEKTDTQYDATDKFETATSGNEEMNNKCELPKQPACGDTTGKVFQTIKLDKTQVVLPNQKQNNKGDSELPMFVALPSINKKAKAETPPSSYLIVNRVEEMNKCLPESTNSNMRIIDCNIWPDFQLPEHFHGTTCKEQSDVSNVAVKSTNSQVSSLTMLDVNTEVLNTDNNCHQRFSSRDNPSENKKPADFLKISIGACPTINKKIVELQVHSRKNISMVGKGRDRSPPPCAASNKLDALEEQNTSQNKGSPNITENAPCNVSGLGSSQEKTDLMPIKTAPRVQYFRDVMLRPSKVDAIQMDHACPARSKTGRNYSENSRGNSSQKFTICPPCHMDEVCIGGYIAAHKQERNHSLPLPKETGLDKAPVLTSYVSKKRTLSIDQRSHFTNMPDPNSEKISSFFDKQISWRGEAIEQEQSSSNDVAVICGLNRDNDSLIAQTCPQLFKAGNFSKLYSPVAEREFETDRVMRHYSDAIPSKSGKFYLGDNFVKGNVSSFSKHQYSNIGKSAHEFSAGKMDYRRSYDITKIEDKKKYDKHMISENHFNLEEERVRRYYDSSSGDTGRVKESNTPNRRSPNDGNAIIETFESLMQQKRPYYVEHCGKRRENIAVAHCGHSKIIPNTDTISPRRLSNGTPGYDIKIIKNGLNSRSEIKSTKIEANESVSTCSNVSTNFSEESATTNENFCFYTKNTDEDGFQNDEISLSEDCQETCDIEKSFIMNSNEKIEFEVEEDEYLESKKESDEETEVVKEEERHEREMEDDEGCGEDQGNDDDVYDDDSVTKIELDPNFSHLDSDERESWNRMSHEDSVNIVEDDDQKVDYSEESEYLDLEQELSEDEKSDD